MNLEKNRFQEDSIYLHRTAAQYLRKNGESLNHMLIKAGIAAFFLIAKQSNFIRIRKLILF